MRPHSICLIGLIALSYQSFTQEPPISQKEQTRDREVYLSASKSLSRTGWILLGAGVIGFAVAPHVKTDLGTLGLIVVLSGASIVSSIPCFIVAIIHKKKALAKPVSLYLENMPTNFSILSLRHPIPLVSFKVAVNF